MSLRSLPVWTAGAEGREQRLCRVPGAGVQAAEARWGCLVTARIPGVCLECVALSRGCVFPRFAPSSSWGGGGWSEGIEMSPPACPAPGVEVLGLSLCLRREQRWVGWEK